MKLFEIFKKKQDNQEGFEVLDIKCASDFLGVPVADVKGLIDSGKLHSKLVESPFGLEHILKLDDVVAYKEETTPKEDQGLKISREEMIGALGLMTVKEVEELAKIKYKDVCELAREGKIPAVKGRYRNVCMWLFSRSDIKNRIKKGTLIVEEPMREEPMREEPFKRCSTCGVNKPHSEFHKDASARDGLKARCRTCTSAVPKKPKTKTCTACGKTKPREDFWKNRNMKDGLQCYCIDCMNEKLKRKEQGEEKKAKNYYSGGVVVTESEWRTIMGR